MITKTVLQEQMGKDFKHSIITKVDDGSDITYELLLAMNGEITRTQFFKSLVEAKNKSNEWTNKGDVINVR